MSDSRTSSPQRTEVPRAKDSLETSKNPIFAGASQETSKNKPTSKISDRQNKNDKNNNDKTPSSPNRQKSKVKSSSQKKDDQATGMVFHSSMALMIRKLMIAAQVRMKSLVSRKTLPHYGYHKLLISLSPDNCPPT